MQDGLITPETPLAGKGEHEGFGHGHRGVRAGRPPGLLKTRVVGKQEGKARRLKEMDMLKISVTRRQLWGKS